MNCGCAKRRQQLKELITMAKQDVQRAKDRLKLKAEQLNLRIKKEETAQALKDINDRLKRMGGRIR